MNVFDIFSTPVLKTNFDLEPIGWIKLMRTSDFENTFPSIVVPCWSHKVYGQSLSILKCKRFLNMPFSILLLLWSLQLLLKNLFFIFLPTNSLLNQICLCNRCYLNFTMMLQDCQPLWLITSQHRSIHENLILNKSITCISSEIKSTWTSADPCKWVACFII